MKLLGCALLGVIAAAFEVIVSPGVLGVAWLGILLAVAIVAVGSILSAEIAGLSGGGAYALCMFAVTLWWLNYSPATDILTLPGDAVATIWPLLSLVAALIPLRFRATSE